MLFHFRTFDVAPTAEEKQISRTVHPSHKQPHNYQNYTYLSMNILIIPGCVRIGICAAEKPSIIALDEGF